MKIPKETEKKAEALKQQLAAAKTPDERLRALLELTRELWSVAPRDVEKAVKSAVSLLGTKGKVGALKEQLKKARTSDERLRILLELAEELWLVAPREARPFLEQAIEEASEVEQGELLAKAANMLAEICRNAGEPDSSQRYAELALRVARKVGSLRTEAGALNALGILHEYRAEYDQAREHYERCLELSREVGYIQGEQAALNQLAGLFGLQGQPQKALECYQKCLETDERLGDHQWLALHRHNIGWALEQMGRWEEATESLYRAIALSEQYGFEDLRLNATNSLGELFLKRNRLEQAIDLFNTVIGAERKQPHYQELLSIALGNLGRARFRLGDLAGAERAYTEALMMCEQAGNRRELAINSWRMAELALAKGQLERVESLLARASELTTESGLRRERGEILRVQALLFAEQNEAAKARDSFEKAMAALESLDDSYELARTRFHYGRFLLNSGERKPASGFLKAAAQAFGRLSVVAESEEVNRLLFQLEMPVDKEAALLSGVGGLAAVGLEPVSFFDRVLKLLNEGLGFESGAVLLENRPVVLLQHPDLKAAKASGRRRELVSTDTALCFPVRSADKVLGCVYLERGQPGGVQSSPGMLERVADLLAEPMRKLAELPLQPEREIEIRGLRYRGFTGRNQAMLENLRLVSKVASAMVPVLVRGESGTGKELIARALHESGARRDKPFVAVNCAAVPEGLLEAEFFGVEKGAATGVAQRKGKFEQAHGGTVFLDEVGDMSHALQARLLRVLQEKTFERVGGLKPIETDVRVVAATNKNLDEMMRQGKFREDLYYRLNAVDLLLPPLRERRDDIRGFVTYLGTRCNLEFGRNILGPSDEVMDCFLAYDWPGNIRQLQHVVERAVILAQGSVLEMKDLPPEFQQVQPVQVEGSVGGLRKARKQVQAKAVADVERAMLLDCLERVNWNVSKAAELAGYSRAQFYRLMRKHRFTRPK